MAPLNNLDMNFSSFLNNEDSFLPQTAQQQTLSRKWLSTVNKALDGDKVEHRLKKMLICLEMKITDSFKH